MKKNEDASIERRSVFKMLGIGAIASMMYNVLPARASKSKMPESNSKQSGIKVKIHPSAIHREKSRGVK